ncbi:MAG: lytic transglycosylase [Betaproteobacteria bacterium HGW-Betaproteobacteria-22]|nr:MAG: lytic transglycosylase [Betaproteobacteria bacterium HGW-Betaproteobacteria-22]
MPDLIRKSVVIFLAHFARCCALALLFMTTQAWAMSDEAIFKHARDAYKQRNEISLSDDVAQLIKQDYLLAPYADYWLMLLRLNNADNAEVLAFINRYENMVFTDRLRGEWLKRLGKQQDWTTFFEQYGFFRRSDTAVECYALTGRILTTNADVSAQARVIWLTSADLPSACDPLFDTLQKIGVLKPDDIWAKLRLALHDGKLNVAKNITTRIPEFSKNSVSLLDVANKTPGILFTGEVRRGKKVAEARLAKINTPADNEVALYAIDRLARTGLDTAVAVLTKMQAQLSEDDRAFAWGRVAYHAARRHHPQALDLYALTKGITLDKEQLAWWVRAALRAQRWDTVLLAINQMQDDQLQEGGWRYWKARAYLAQNKQVEANAILGPLSTERHYYGWLAAEELESIVSSPLQQFSPSDIEVLAIASQPAIKRALALQQLDMRWEARAEWVWAVQDFDDKQLLAAAEYAYRQKWFDVAISTADNTRQLHDFSLRYPVPYRDLFRAAAVNEGLDEAWIYGLTRQESRFMHYAKSGVGASGLMQLMPATAKWAAKRMGLSAYSNDMIHDLKFNVGIGTYYMRYTLEMMNGQYAMATAAYNAGPSRAKRWMAEEPLEAAIYIETIPFTETRLYVQKVMANAQMYAPRLGMPVQSLKSRIGIVPGKVNAKADTVLADSE